MLYLEFWCHSNNIHICIFIRQTHTHTHTHTHPIGHNSINYYHSHAGITSIAIKRHALKVDEVELFRKSKCRKKLLGTFRKIFKLP